MPSKYVPCVHCGNDTRLAASIVKKHRIKVFICDSCATKVQNKYKNMGDAERDSLVKKSGFKLKK